MVDLPLVFGFGAAVAFAFGAGEFFLGGLELRLLERSDFLTPTGYLFLDSKGLEPMSLAGAAILFTEQC